MICVKTWYGISSHIINMDKIFLKAFTVLLSIWSWDFSHPDFESLLPECWWEGSWCPANWQWSSWVFPYRFFPTFFNWLKIYSLHFTELIFSLFTRMKFHKRKTQHNKLNSYTLHCFDENYDTKIIHYYTCIMVVHIIDLIVEIPNVLAWLQQLL